MNIQFIHFPMKYGCNTPGADEASEALNSSQWCDHHQIKTHSIPITQVSDSTLPNDNTIMNAAKLHHDVVLSILQKGDFPLSFGGDHTCGIGGPWAAMLAYPEDVTILWLDAHADTHTQHTSPSKHIHGMPCAILQGCCDEPLKIDCSPLLTKHMVYVGLNSYEEAEINHIHNQGIAHLNATMIQSIGIKETLNWIRSHIKTKALYVSFDLDVLHPDVFYSVNVNMDQAYTTGLGLQLDEVKAILTMLISEYQCVGMDVVEYNPRLDTNNQDFNQMIALLDHIVHLVKEKTHES